MLPMQENTVKACIRAHAPYLRHILKMDNLPPFCKHVSEQVLHAILDMNVGQQFEYV